MNDAQRKGRRTLLVIAGLFTFPIVVAMYMYFTNSTFIPGMSTEHGEFITPPRSLPDTQLSATDPQARFRKTWALLVLADQRCDSTCIEALEHIRQIRLSLGPKMTRLNTVYLPGASTAVPVELAEEHPKLIVVDPANSAEIRSIIGTYSNGEIFMVDPLGNLMMRYAPDTGMGDIRKDVAHLFKLSGIG